ncbi:DUF4124 domain-containing protein [Luteimonas sp. RIT-PG2_3]
MSRPLTIVMSATAVAVLMLSSTALAWSPQSAELYQWKDAQGVTHYSQTPPDKGERYQQRQINNPQSSPIQQQASQGASPANGSGTPASPGQESAQCKSARSNIVALSSSNPVRGTDADGTPGEVLSDAQRASQLELAQAAVKAYCTSAAN